jgi:hypothetical protein
VAEQAGFPGWERALFHIDEAMSWESVRNSAAKMLSEAMSVVKRVSIRGPSDRRPCHPENGRYTLYQSLLLLLRYRRWSIGLPLATQYAAIQRDGIQRDEFFIWITEKQADYLVKILGEKIFRILWFSQGQPINSGAGVVHR